VRFLLLSLPFHRAGLGHGLSRDPGYGPALALAAMCTQQLHNNGWTDSPELSGTGASITLAEPFGRPKTTPLTPRVRGRNPTVGWAKLVGGTQQG
jgi:hypothetical protein